MSWFLVSQGEAIAELGQEFPMPDPNTRGWPLRPMLGFERVRPIVTRMTDLQTTPMEFIPTEVAELSDPGERVRAIQSWARTNPQVRLRTELYRQFTALGLCIADDNGVSLRAWSLTIAELPPPNVPFVEVMASDFADAGFESGPPFYMVVASLGKPDYTRPAGLPDSRTGMSFIIRDAVASDVPALARLHVTTYNETHAPESTDGPTYEIREYQWRKAFQYRQKRWFRLLIDRGTPWFCFVIENQNGELVGFAKGKRYAHRDQPDFSGELNKIYILRAYHRRGLGRRLIGHVARRFLSQGISSMLLFGDAYNPSNRFYEAMGGERLFAASGAFHGGYGWRDLRKLVLLCRID